MGKIIRFLFFGLALLLFHGTTHASISSVSGLPELGMIAQVRVDNTILEKKFRWGHDLEKLSSSITEMSTEADQPVSDIGLERDEEDFDLEGEFEEATVSEIFDPLSGYNRFMTEVNDKFYFWLIRPTATGYNSVVPQGARLSVNRFFVNLLFPVRFVNNILQFKFKGAGVELARFGVNTTVGILGFTDPAKQWLDLNPYPEDFGQTLGFYGIGTGFHLVLPIFGPSNLRDALGLFTDFYLDPVCYVGLCYLGHWEAALGTRAYDFLNYSSLHIGEYESVKKDAIDFYRFLRDAYEQHRKKVIEE